MVLPSVVEIEAKSSQTEKIKQLLNQLTSQMVLKRLNKTDPAEPIKMGKVKNRPKICQKETLRMYSEKLLLNQNRSEIRA